MPEPELDPKTLVWYPFFSIVLFLLLYIAFEIPFWIFFIVIALNVLYVLIFIIVEIYRK